MKAILVQNHQSRQEMGNQFDIAAYSPDRQLVLLAEVKWLKELTEEEAAFFRRNLLAHQLLTEVPYFLLAHRNAFFLWKGKGTPGNRPDFKAAAKPVLKKYLGDLADTGSGAGPESMELAVKLWLSDLASGIEQPDPNSEADKMLVDSGLLDSLKGGEVRREYFE
jgi:hypothetical protein